MAVQMSLGVTVNDSKISFVSGRSAIPSLRKISELFQYSKDQVQKTFESKGIKNGRFQILLQSEGGRTRCEIIEL